MACSDLEATQQLIQRYAKAPKDRTWHMKNALAGTTPFVSMLWSFQENKRSNRINHRPMNSPSTALVENTSLLLRLAARVSEARDFPGLLLSPLLGMRMTYYPRLNVRVPLFRKAHWRRTSIRSTLKA
jgi:hypothetical protein